MAELSIHLRESFRNDRLIVRINGTERRHLEGVTTKLLLGYAEVLVEDVAAGRNLVAIELLTRQQTASAQIDVSENAHLEVWYSGGQLTLRIPPEPPAYL